MSNPSTQIAKRIKSAKVVLKVITAEDSKKQVGAEKEGRKEGGGGDIIVTAANHH